LEAGVSYSTKLQGVATNWALGIDNLLNRQFFKESPYQFGHIYLFPQQPRSLRISMQAAL
jgi:iron complex outermembrane recepter protein